LWKAYLVSSASSWCAILCLTNWMWEPSEPCQGPAKPVNQSGMHVLVHGMMKTGTKSMAQALHRLGYATYHSEDFFTSVWTDVVDEYWRRPEQGGPRLATPFPPAHLGNGKSDVTVLNNTSPERLAEAFSRCGVQALAFDGIEKLFWPLYEVSPDVKVVSLSWRTYDQFRKSKSHFLWKMELIYYIYGLLCSAPHLLPYNYVLFPLFDRLSGGDITKWLHTGQPAPTLAGEGLARKFFRQSIGARRWWHHMRGGLHDVYQSREEYEAFFDEARRRVPPHRFFEWDMKRHTMKDLCMFLNISGHEGCDLPGPLPKVDNLFYIERANPYETMALVPLYLLLHYLNWRFLSLACRPCGRCCCRRAEKRAKEE